MDKKNSKFNGNNVVKNSIWAILERVCAQIVSFIISIILARLLMPNDYGILALVQSFISICSLLIDRGLASALSQKKYPDKIDYYSVLNFGFFVSILLYVLLYFAAPFVSGFFTKYDSDLLTTTIRLMSIAIPITTIRTIIITYLGKNMMFKKMFWATFIGTVVSGCAGILIAYNNGGVFSLVAQHLINFGLDTILLAFVIKKPWETIISFSRLKVLFKYGWKVLMSSTLTTLVNGFRNTTIAANYQASDLACYEKGESLPKIVIGNIDVAIANVLFQTMSNAQDDLLRLKEIVRKFVKLTGYVIYPMLIGIFCVSDSLIPVLFGEQWIGAIPYLKIFALIYLFYPLQDSALLSIRAIGKSGTALIVDIIGKSVILLAMFLLLNFDPIFFTLGFLASTIVVVLINAVAMKKYINYKFKEQLFDFFINLIPSFVMLISIYFISFIQLDKIIILIIQIIVGIVIYLVFSIITKNKQFPITQKDGRI